MYDKEVNKQLSRRERVLLNPLEASQKSDSPFRKSLKETNYVMNGVQHVYKFPNGYGASVVKHDGSYGGTKGLFEIMVSDSTGGVELPGITEEGDTVKGFLTLEDVSAICKKMTAITGNDPVKVAI